MNELIIAGIIGVVLIGVFAIAWVVENPDRIGEWLFDLGTAYCMFKAKRARRKNKQYLNTRKETNL